MATLKVTGGLGRLGLLGALLLASCSDESDEDRSTQDSAVGTAPDASVEGEPDGSLDEMDGGETPGDDGSAGDSSVGLALPAVLSLSGCGDLGVPALCSVTQTGEAFQANCAGVLYTGSLKADRSFSMAAPEQTLESGAKVNLSCTGSLERNGSVTANCKQTSSAVGDSPAGEESCQLRSDTVILPGINCIELPAELTDVVICKEGAANDGTTLNAGTCKVIQDGCAFQAECANDVVITGTASKTGVSFSRRLKALADAAATPPATPAFLKGAEVNHSCTGTLSEGTLTGTCSAGGSRGAPATSVCAMEGKGAELPDCAPLAPSNEHLFVLDSCEILKEGEAQTPGIGEPVCAFRQNRCVWDIQCGNNPLTKFQGRLPAGATKVEWRLLTGTPCELQFDAQGNMTGKCTVPGQTSCQLSSKDAVPGAATCPALPANTSPRSHGCGGGDPLDCRAALQHGCNYLAVCKFSDRYPDEIIAGETSFKSDNTPFFEFNGVNGFNCYVQKANEAEITSGDREATEWYGDCMNSAGGMCRNTWNPETKTGFRSLRVYFEPL